MRITIKASSRGKVPSVYVNKTFEVIRTRQVGDPIEIRGKMIPCSWDSYEGVTSTGRKIRFTLFASLPNCACRLQVEREGFVRGTWIPEGEYEIGE